MANVKVTLDYQINDGMSLTFKAPCDCTEVTGLKIYYPIITEDESTIISKVFTFKDAHGNDLSSIGNLFTNRAYVKVVLDIINNYAYIQNADTNGYLEDRFNGIGTIITENIATHNTDEAAHPYILHQLVDRTARIKMLEDFLYNDITGNPHSITFVTLDGLVVTGVWNETQARLEC